jgi:hypothetical protein
MPYEVVSRVLVTASINGSWIAANPDEANRT